MIPTGDLAVDTGGKGCRGGMEERVGGRKAAEKGRNNRRFQQIEIIAAQKEDYVPVYLFFGMYMLRSGPKKNKNGTAASGCLVYFVS